MKEKSIGIIGGNGLVGGETVKFFSRKEYLVLSPSSSKVNITNKSEVRDYIHSLSAESVILLAAYTNVDGAESDPDEAYRVNVLGTRNVIEAADQVHKKVVAISTDMVFPGDLAFPGPYNEAMTSDVGAESGRIGVYADSKRLAEEIVLNSLGNHAVVRISFPFGNRLNNNDLVNKAKFMIDNGYPIIDDQLITPTYLPDLNIALDAIIQKDAAGIFHVATLQSTTMYKLASDVAARLGIKGKLKRGSFDDLFSLEKRQEKETKSGRKIAPRVQFGGLSCKPTQVKLDIQFHSLKEALDEFLD